MNTSERIERIRTNLAENERLYLSGKRTRKVYLACRADGRRAISELVALRGKERAR